MFRGDYETSVHQDPDALFDSDPVSPERVQDTLSTFNNRVMAASADEPVGQQIARRVASRMWQQLICSPVPPTQGEKRRMASLCEAFTKVGAMLDADETKAPAYHNRAHNLVVMATMMMRNRCAAHFEKPETTAEDVILSMRRLLMGLMHDAGHNGTNNQASGSYVPGELEMASFERVEPLLKQAGVSQEDQDHLRLGLYGTDVLLPGTIARYAYGFHFGQLKSYLGHTAAAPTREKVEEALNQLPAEAQEKPRLFLQALEASAALAKDTMILTGCDLVPSFGLGDASSRKQSQLFHKESPFPVVDEKGEPLPKGQLFTMFNFVGAEIGQRGEGGGFKVRARFVDPILNLLFGRNLVALQADCERRAGAETVREQRALVGHRLNCTPI